MRCPSCNHDNPGDASFCEECGSKLELICPACKASVSPGGAILQEMWDCNWSHKSRCLHDRFFA